MTLIYRTDGSWGTGKGSNLTPAEVDENFNELDTRVGALETDGATPVGIADVTVEGFTFSVHLTDATVLGPFPLPVATYAWQDEWVSGALYAAASIFTYANAETGNIDVYLVLRQYEAPTEFDPDEADTDGPLLAHLFSIPDASRVVVNEIEGGTQLNASQMGYYLRVTTGGDIILPDESLTENSTLRYGSVVTIRAATGDPVTIVGSSTDTIINPPPGMTTTLLGNGSQAALVRVGEDEWDLSGDLVEA